MFGRIAEASGSVSQCAQRRKFAAEPGRQKFNRADLASPHCRLRSVVALGFRAARYLDGSRRGCGLPWFGNCGNAPATVCNSGRTPQTKDRVAPASGARFESRQLPRPGPTPRTCRRTERWSNLGASLRTARPLAAIIRTLLHKQYAMGVAQRPVCRARSTGIAETVSTNVPRGTIVDGHRGRHHRRQG